ncbi:DUF7289 family protein [Methanolobus chelungpuianus]|uniref:DUF7308 domain-containing protein n=1 Tax=Methanolobus chelungpuianus TaxID=502115 RepID=A0AAE3KVN7_9EURY|nr:hypothetical protein [Methanolobus chelungpuianus]MCQ6961716.1 hypothetical protein [Methanolobus chelungpuianus]
MLKNDTAVSSVIGISIILVISLLSIGLMLLYTAPLIGDTQEMAKAQKVEQAFTVFDSRTSKSSLGESPLQTTSLTLMGENIAVHGNPESYNESSIMVIALSSDSSWYNSFYPNRGTWNSWKWYEENEQNFTGFNASMGKVRYYSGNRIIAYEGGGIWSRYPDGGTIMVSPPEFHYNGETLTLPIMKVTGSDSVGGSSNVNMKVKASNKPVVLYPNTTLGNSFTNPLNCDKILIYFNSEFYDGWAEYAETLTTTTAMLDHRNKTAIIEMDTKPKMGTFPLMNSFKIGKLNQSNSTPIGNFSFYLEAVDTDASNFNPAGSKITATSKTKTLTYEVKKVSQPHPYTLGLTITYTDAAFGDGSQVEVWESISTYPVYSATNKEANSTLDLVNDTYMLKYDSQKSDEEYSWGPISPTRMTPDINITGSNANSIQSVNNITQHYMKLLSQDGVIECTWLEGNNAQPNKNKKNNKINMDESTYTLIYDGGGGVLTYLHITSNDVEVTLE